MTFSVIIPTYTGYEHIDGCLNSILSQTASSVSFEVVVIIDGPNSLLEKKVESYTKLFLKKHIPYRFTSLKENQGRLMARLAGAEAARYDQLLFIDDRVTLSTDFFGKLNMRERCVMPNVMEFSHPNIISRTLYLLRKKIYGKANWGASFNTYKVNHRNFEKSPKGTTCLWVPKEEFVEASGLVAKRSVNFKEISDDTAILREIIKSRQYILRQSDLVVYYHPRPKTWQEVKHLYERGPKFIDYYLKVGSRFFVPLVMTGIVALAGLALILSHPRTLIDSLCALLLLDILAALFIQENFPDVLNAILAIPIILASFGLGCLKGILKRGVMYVG